MSAPVAHLVTVHDDPPRAECVCGWERHDNRHWLAVAVAAHLGLRLSTPSASCRHSLCRDDSGHSDGCLYDDGED